MLWRRLGVTGCFVFEPQAVPATERPRYRPMPLPPPIMPPPYMPPPYMPPPMGEPI